jgi:hypothetical protein
MNQRDKAIIKNLERFRVMTRDDICDLHFSNIKYKTIQTNRVMKRLCRDDYIEVSKEYRIYRYFPSPSIKKDSTKIPHFLAIVDFYKQILKYEEPKEFEVEPKVGDKGIIEPDIFMIWKNAPFFVEIQRKIYSKKVMAAKMKRYEQYYYGEQWHSFKWQPKDKKVFPRVWFITDHHYSIIVPFKVIQTKNVNEFMGG